MFTVGTVYNCVQYFVRLVRDNPRFIHYNPLYIHSKLKLLFKIGNYFLDTQYVKLILLIRFPFYDAQIKDYQQGR